MASWTRELSVAAIEERKRYYRKQNQKTANGLYLMTAATIGVANPIVGSTMLAAWGINKALSGGQRFGERNRQGNFPTGSSTLKYPIDLDIQQDHIEIEEFSYGRPRKGGEAQNVAGPEASVITGKKHGGTIVLPMPKVSDASGAEWGKSDLTGVEMNRSTRASGLKGLFRRQGGRLQEEQDERGYDDGTGTGGGANPNKGTARNNQENYWWGRELALRGTTAAKNIKGNVSASSLLARETGQILNPNAELLFQGPSLRSFDFNWLMVARSQKEGEMIRTIIRKLKTGAAPRYNNTMLLETPHIWKISYKRASQPLKTANRFNECALVSITVDYAPDGMWSSYEDSQPIALRMALNFKELRAVYKTDQDLTPLDSVGY